MFKKILNQVLSESHECYEDFEKQYCMECGYSTVQDIPEEEVEAFKESCRKAYETHCSRPTMESLQLEAAPDLTIEKQMEEIIRFMESKLKGLRFKHTRGRGTDDFRIHAFTQNGIEIGQTTCYFSDWQKKITLGGEMQGMFMFKPVSDLMKETEKWGNRTFGHKM